MLPVSLLVKISSTQKEKKSNKRSHLTHPDDADTCDFSTTSCFIQQPKDNDVLKTIFHHLHYTCYCKKTREIYMIV